jgi:hypothetical protein
MLGPSTMLIENDRCLQACPDPSTRSVGHPARIQVRFAEQVWPAGPERRQAAGKLSVTFAAQYQYRRDQRNRPTIGNQMCSARIGVNELDQKVAQVSWAPITPTPWPRGYRSPPCYQPPDASTNPNAYGAIPSPGYSEPSAATTPT